MTEEKALTVQARAIAALGLENYKEDLVKLASKSVDLAEITNEDSYKQIHTARMVLKNERIDITKKAKAARDDANVFSKAVIVEERALIAIISPEEDRLAALQKDHDEKEECERQAKIDAEIERVETIQARIEDIRTDVDAIINSPRSWDEIAEYIEIFRSNPIDNSFQEFQRTAQDAWDAGLARLNAHHEATADREAEDARIAAEREELAQLRADAERRDAEAAATAKKERKVEEKRLAAEETKREADEYIARKEREEEEEKQREEFEAKQKEQAEEQERIDVESKRLAGERQRLADEEAERKRKADADRIAEGKRKAAALAKAKKAEYPGDAEIVSALAEHFDVPVEVATAWFDRIAMAA